jgi:hypothetical protein
MLRSSKVVTLEVSLAAFRLLMKLPDDVKLLKVRQTWEQERAGKFDILVEGPDLQEVSDGEVIPWGKCTMHAEFCKADEVYHIVRSEVENY